MTQQLELWPHGTKCRCRECILRICKRIAADLRAILDGQQPRRKEGHQ